MERASREIRAESTVYRAVEAWRAPGGHGLLYLISLEGEGGPPGSDDRRDRRLLLEPGTDVEALDRDALAARAEEGRPLTETERRFSAPDGRVWLAQSVGPVWAEGGVAEGLTEILFTSLEGPHRRISVPGGHVGRMGADEVIEAWSRARASAEEASGAS